MTVQKKLSVNANAKTDEKLESKETKVEETNVESAGASGIANKVIEPVNLEEALSEEVPFVGSAAASDPLTEFKEKMNMEEQSLPETPAKKNFMWPILFIFIFAILVLTGVFLYKRGGVNINLGTKVNVVTLSPTPVVIVEPTKAVVDLTKYEVEILNGGGVAGEASRQRVSLEAAGFTISSVDNADNSDYTDTIIKAKAAVEKGFLDKLKSALGDTFTVGQTEVLSDTSSVPVVLILGTKK